MRQKIIDILLIKIKKIIPLGVFNFLSPLYHRALAYLAAFFYGRPAEKMIIIGITGTNGKSTTVNLIAAILEKAGFKIGAISTVNFKIGEKVWLNNTKMTMPGRFQLQKMLSQMVKAGCQYGVIETSSQGLAQFRHLGINYDSAVFTNLTPEHLEAHGGFENYKAAKGELFRHLTKLPQKKIAGEDIKKTIIVNLDDKYADYFLFFEADEKYGYRIKSQIPNSLPSRDLYDKSQTNSKFQIQNSKFVTQAENIQLTPEGTKFTVNGVSFHLQLLGEFNIYNALAAINVAQSQNIGLEKCASALAKIKGIPGRLERIDEGQNFAVIVDYAPEPTSLIKAYEVIKTLPHQRIIHLLGSTGGGRDVARRPILGRIAAQNADIVIVTNEDPYNDDPQEIINQVAEGAEKSGKVLENNLFKILDRREAIKKALRLASEGDLVLITGKGAEQAMVVKDNQKIPWDDRVVVREELKRLKAGS